MVNTSGRRGVRGLQACEIDVMRSGYLLCLFCACLGRTFCREEVVGRSSNAGSYELGMFILIVLSE